MRNFIWVRVVIASFAFLGENALAFNNDSDYTNPASVIGHVADASKPVVDSDFDSDSHLFIVRYRLVSLALLQINSFWVFDPDSIPVQSRYLLSYSRAPPVKLI